MWIPPELCTCMPGQPYRGKLSERQTTNILNVAARPPAENARRIVGDGQEVIGVRGAGASALATFGVTINTHMIMVFGRVLEAPGVLYKGSSEKTSQAAWNMRGKQFSVTKSLTKWSFLKVRLSKVLLPPLPTLWVSQANPQAIGLEHVLRLSLQWKETNTDFDAME